MRSIPVVLAVLCASLAAVASGPHDSSNVAARHARLASRTLTSLEERAAAPRRRCKVPKPKTTTSSPAKAAETKKSTPNTSPNTFTGATGLIRVKSNCGDIGASQTITKTAGPNGKLSWLNCGIESGGWRPPFIKVSDLVTVPLSTALKSSNSPFHACSKFAYLFERFGNQHGIPPIMLTAFALQESSCNPATQGQGGEQGLMQITKDKCGGAPGGNCKDPEFNIGTAAAYFAKTLKEDGGNVLLSIGRYNGWTPGLTVGKATAARNSACCRCQNNLDYLHQFVNGWLQNYDAYTHKLGSYNNLDGCP